MSSSSQTNTTKESMQRGHAVVAVCVAQQFCDALHPVENVEAAAGHVPEDPQNVFSDRPRVREAGPHGVASRNLEAVRCVRVFAHDRRLTHTAVSSMPVLLSTQFHTAVSGSPGGSLGTGWLIFLMVVNVRSELVGSPPARDFLAAPRFARRPARCGCAWPSRPCAACPIRATHAPATSKKKGTRGK
jgi:hypothetical protein